MKIIIKSLGALQTPRSLPPTSNSGKEKLPINRKEPFEQNQARIGGTILMAGWVKEGVKEGRRGRGQKRHIHHTCKHVNYTEESKVELSGSHSGSVDSL